MNLLFPGDPDPYPALAELRQQAPAHLYAGTWFVVSYPLAQELLRHGQLSRQAYLDQLQAQFGSSPILEAQRRELAFQDPPAHTAIKRLVMQAFSPTRLKQFAGHIEALVTEAVRALPQDEPFDMLAELADPLPARVLSELLGIDPARRTELYQATADLVHARGVERTPETMERGNRGVATLQAAFQELARQPRGDNLFSALLEAEEEGHKLAHDQLLAVVTSLYAASYGNVRNLIGNGLLAWLDHPQQIVQGLVPQAVEEMLRFDSPTQATNAAVLTQACGELPAGARVAIHLGACNRDPAHFPAPDRFQVDRHPNDHLAFSFGTHFCAGAHLVRLQAQAIFQALLPYRIQLVERPQYQHLDRFRGLLSLRVKVHPP